MPYKNPEDRKRYMRQYFLDHQDEFREVAREAYRQNPEQFSKWRKGRKTRLKLEVFAAYGNKCSCPGCDVTFHEFLTIDHIHGGGRQHRKAIGGSECLYYWLRRNGYPQDEFRLMCINCNLSRGLFGYCPHERIPVISFD